MSEAATEKMIITDLWGPGGLTTVDVATGIVFADVEKAHGTGDLQCCWLAAASNIMYWSGWVTAGDGTIANEDRFMDYSLQYWDDTPGLEVNAFSWWLNGTAAVSSQTVPAGGDKFPQLDPDDFSCFINAYYTGAIDDIRKCMDAGCGVTLGITDGSFSHAITCWGYEVDDGAIYLYYSDSDDHKASNSDRRTAQNTLYRGKVEYNANEEAFMLDYWFADGVCISDFTAMLQYDPIFSGRDETVADSRAVGLAAGVSTRRGRFDAGGYDNDYYSLTVDGTLALAASRLAGYNADFSLVLLDADGNEIGVWSGSDIVCNVSGLSGTYYLRFGAMGEASEDILSGVYAFSVSSDHLAVKWTGLETRMTPVAAGLTGTVYIAELDGFADGVDGFAAGIEQADFSCAYIYGGSSASNVGGGCRTFIMNGASYGIYGGGASGTVIGGAVELKLENVTLKSLLLGGGGSTVGGDIYLTVSDCGGTGNYFGGAAGAFVAGDIFCEYDGGYFTGLIYGGCRTTGVGGGCGSVRLAVSGLTQQSNLKILAQGSTAWLVGGGQAIDGGSLQCGDVNINVSGGAKLRYIVGGAQAEGAGSAADVGRVSISIASATVDGSIYGGGYAVRDGISTVTGGVAITVDSTGVTSIYGNIYGGGTNPLQATGGRAMVKSGAIITFTGSGDNLNFSGVVCGDGAASGTVSGEKVLAFDNFSGAFMATARDFDTLEISDSAVAMTSAVSVECARFRITGEPDDVMLKTPSARFEQLEIELDVAMLSASRDFLLLETGDIGNFDDDPVVYLYDAGGAMIGGIDGFESGETVEAAGGSLSLAIAGNMLVLRFLA
ncbi:MAG: hypothetical protein AB7F40_09870 [Victivallaceae bacterium]|nr:hypothetical protein [Victivallaceae bacterium]